MRCIAHAERTCRVSARGRHQRRRPAASSTHRRDRPQVSAGDARLRRRVFDADGDGRQDVLLMSGISLDRRAARRRDALRLFRNNGRGSVRGRHGQGRAERPDLRHGRAPPPTSTTTAARTSRSPASARAGCSGTRATDGSSTSPRAPASAAAPGSARRRCGSTTTATACSIC